MKKYELPVGFAMALAMNETAMAKFEKMNESEKEAVIKRTHNVNSKNEMRMIVDSLLK